MVSAVSMGQLIPPEVSSAAATLSAARQDALPTSAARRARVAFFLATWAVGSWLGLLLLELGLVAPSDKDIWRASLTAISVLSGFMIATMLTVMTDTLIGRFIPGNKEEAAKLTAQKA